MERSDHETRVSLHASVGSRLALLSDAALSRLVQPVALHHPLMGGHGAIDVAGTRVFAKRIPMTELDLAHPHSTKNHHQLPLVYSYGIGSAGFGAWREVAAASQASNWVLAGDCPGFPLLYHVRILRRRTRKRKLPGRDYEGYLEYWNRSARLAKFVEARHLATHDAVLFLEHFPHTLMPWLGANLSSTPRVLAQMQALTDFLRSKDVVHFDAHHQNLMTDGKSLFLTDFGLASNAGFELTARERTFLENNSFVDIGTFVHRCLGYLMACYRGRPAGQRALIRKWVGAPDKTHNLVLERLLLEKLDELRDRGLLRVPEAYAAELARWREVSLFMADFYGRLIFDNRKRAKLDNKRLGQLVAAARER